MSACKLRHGVPQSEVRFAGIANGRVAVNIKLLLRAGLVLLYLAQVEIARVS